MDVYSNLLLVGGSKQNVGKTTLIIDLIEKLSDNNKIVAIKTSCHFHGILDTDLIVEHNNEFTIVEETATYTGKDSARMLQAGALRTFFIQAKDEFLKKAFDKVVDMIGCDVAIVCETSILREFLIPKLFIALVRDKKENVPEDKSVLKKADLLIENYFNNKNIISTIEIVNNKWTL
jgi:molybdopterin-guanine dinucleotide biosynthesis protein